MVSALVPGASGPGSTPGRGKTLNSHSASLHPGELAPKSKLLLKDSSILLGGERPRKLSFTASAQRQTVPSRS